MSIDFDKCYTVPGSGIAMYVVGYVERDTPDTHWSGIREIDKQRVRVVYVGDDHEYIIDTDNLVELGSKDYCPECGQVGCRACTMDDEQDDERELPTDEAEDRYESILNESCEPFKIGALEYEAGRVLREIDPIAFRQGMLCWADSEDIEVV